MEQDQTGLWNLTRALNNDNPSKSKTVIETNNELIYQEESCKCFFQTFTWNRTPLMFPESALSRSERKQNTILSSYGEERDCSMTDSIHMKELKDALKKVKTRKALGQGGITGEMLKHLETCSRAVLLKIVNHSWMKEVVLAAWKEAVVIPVPKKGEDKKNPRSYRPISLLICVGKLLVMTVISDSSAVLRATVCYCNERHSFHARVGRFSPFLYLRSVAIAVILFWLQLVVLVSPCFLGSRISRDYCFPRAPLFLCSERKSS